MDFKTFTLKVLELYQNAEMLGEDMYIFGRNVEKVIRQYRNEVNGGKE